MSLQVFYHLVRTEFVKDGFGTNPRGLSSPSHSLLSDEVKKGLYKAEVPRSFFWYAGTPTTMRKRQLCPFSMLSNG